MRLDPRAPAEALLLALCAFVPACDVVFEEQEVHLRWDRDSDSADLILIYRGLTASEDAERATAKAVEQMVRLAAGARELMIVEWPLWLPLDELVREAKDDLFKPDLDAATRSRLQKLLEVEQRIVLAEHGLYFAGAEGAAKLCGYQRFRVREVSRVLRLLNQMVNEALLDQAATGDLEPDSDVDQETIDRWLEHARGDREWFAIGDEAVTVTVPASRAVSGRIRREFLEELVRDGADSEWLDFVVELFAEADRLEFGAGGFAGVWRAQAPGHLAFTFRNRAVVYHDALARELVAEGVADAGSSALPARLAPLVAPPRSR